MGNKVLHTKFVCKDFAIKLCYHSISFFKFPTFIKMIYYYYFDIQLKTDNLYTSKVQQVSEN